MFMDKALTLINYLLQAEIWSEDFASITRHQASSQTFHLSLTAHPTFHPPLHIGYLEADLE